MNSYELDQITEEHLNTWRTEVAVYVVLMFISAVIGFCFGVMT